MPLKATTGSFTVVDMNQPGPSYFWKGEKLLHVLSITAFIRPPAPRRVTLRVTAPDAVVPALDAATKTKLLAIYNEMTAAGITVLQTNETS